MEGRRAGRARGLAPPPEPPPPQRPAVPASSPTGGATSVCHGRVHRRDPAGRGSTTRQAPRPGRPSGNPAGRRDLSPGGSPRAGSVASSLTVVCRGVRILMGAVGQLSEAQRRRRRPGLNTPLILSARETSEAGDGGEPDGPATCAKSGAEGVVLEHRQTALRSHTHAHERFHPVDVGSSEDRPDGGGRLSHHVGVDSVGPLGPRSRRGAQSQHTLPANPVNRRSA